MTRARVISAIVLIAVAAALAAWLWPSRNEPERSDELRVEAPPTESGPALAVLPESGDLAPAMAAAKAGAGSPGEASPATNGEAAKDARTTLRVEVKVGDAVRPGVTVRVRPSGDTTPLQTATTDASGLVEFKDVDPQAIVVEGFGEGLRVNTWVQQWRNDASWRDESGVVHLRLEEGIPLEGRVLDSGTGLPISGASVVVQDWSDECEVGPSDAAGKFHVGALMNDNVATITVRARGHVPESLKVHLDGGKPQPTEAVLRLRRGGAIVGVVRAPDGKPVPRARVQIGKRSPPPANEEGSALEAPLNIQFYEYDDDILEGINLSHGAGDLFVATTDATGEFRADGVEFDTDYEATATATGFASSLPSSGIRALSGSADPSLSLVLRRSATVIVTLTYPAGVERTESPRVRLFLGRNEEMRKPTSGDAARGFHFENVDPGRFVAYARQERFLSAATRGEVVEGESVTVSIPLEAGAVVEGMVVDKDGAPVANAEIAAAAAEGQGDSRSSTYLSRAREARSGPDGRFSVTGLQPGPVLLIARRHDGEQVLATRERFELTAPASNVKVVVLRQGVVRMRLIAPDGSPFTGNAWIHVEDLPSGGGGGWGGPIENGVVEQTWLEEGSHLLVVSPDAYAWIRRPFEIHDGATVDFGDVRLDPGITLSGRLLDTAGKPVVDALVKCLETDRRSTKTDADGRFALDRFPRDPVTLELSKATYSSMKLVVEPTKPAGLEIRMTRPATISGTIRAADGKATSSAGITLARPGAKTERGATYVGIGEDDMERDWSQGGSIDCEETGTFKVTVPAGRWTVWWEEAEGKDRAIAEWAIVDGETRTIDIDLPAK